MAAAVFLLAGLKFWRGVAGMLLPYKYPLPEVLRDKTTFPMDINKPRHLPNLAALDAPKVLCIEDNESNLMLVERILKSQRPAIKLLTARTGTAGIETARSQRPSVVLLDLHLPDLDGDKVLEQLRADPGTHMIPVVIISADATRAQINRLLAAGAERYLTKPLEMRLLLSLIDELLDAQNATGRPQSVTA
jgi:CheY-like chemotaxis protein